MNKLLNPISWSAYLEGTFILLALYYAWIGWKYYQPEINALLNKVSGKKDEANALPAALQFQGSEQQENINEALEPAITHSHNVHDEYAEERSELTEDIQTVINAAQGQPYNPAALTPKLKKLLNEHTHLAVFPHRDAINELIVQECEKTGTALLSEGEVDLWWDA